MNLHQKHMFLKPLKAQTMWKTLETIIAKRMQNMVHFENKNIIVAAEILLIFLQKVESSNMSKQNNMNIHQKHVL